MLFLTGANMAGKSTLMKAFGIAVYLAHMGFPVAAAGMNFSVMDGLFSSIDVPDDLNMGYSLDQPGKKDAWLEAIAKDGLNWTQLSDLTFWKNDVALLYGIKAIPQNFLIDPTGKIIATNLRAEALQNKLAELIK